MRQRVEAGERRPALEVDEHEVQALRRVGQREPEHQRAQQFGLARSGRADHQAVWPHAALRRLLDVDVDRLSAHSDADRHPKPVAGRPRAPGDVRIDLVRIAETEQIRQAQVDGERIGRLGRRSRHPQRRHRPHQRLHLGDAEVVGGTETGDLRRPGAILTLHRHRAALDPQLQDARVVVRPQYRVEVQDGHTLDEPGGELCLGRNPAAVDHHDDVRAVAAAGDAEARATGQRVAEHRFERQQIVADHPRLADRVERLRGQAVRQPLDPLPGVLLLRTRADGDHHVVG